MTRVQAEVILFALACWLGVAQPGSSWEWLSPLPQGNDLNAVASHDGQRVAVGALGTILRSEAGSAWAAVPSPSTGTLAGVAWRGDGWLAVSQEGELLTSPDGLAWQVRRPALPGAGALGKVAVLGGLTILTRGCDVLTSDDLERWRLYRGMAGATLNGLASSGSAALAVGDKGVFLVSTTGGSWTTSFWPVDLVAVASGGGRFVFLDRLGRATASSNLRQFDTSPLPPGGSYRAVGWVGDRFVAVGARSSGGLLMAESQTGVGWTPVTASGDGYAGRAVAPSDLGGVIVGEAGTILERGEDGEWQVAVSRPVPLAHDIAWNGREWIALINPEPGQIGWTFLLGTSSNGHEWTTDADFQLGLFPLLAAAPSGTVVIVRNGDIATRLPAGSWVTSPAPAWIQTRAVWAGDRFLVLSANGEVMQSRDGIDWEYGSVPVPVTLRAASRLGEVLVIVGGDANASGTSCSISPCEAFFTSHDGRSWVAQPTGFSTFVGFEDIACGPSACIATSGDGRLAASADGSSWHGTGAPPFAFTRVLWSGTSFVGIGVGGRVATSADGSAWQVSAPITTQDLTGIASNGHQLLVWGGKGALLGRLWTPVIPRRRLQRAD